MSDPQQIQQAVEQAEAEQKRQAAQGSNGVDLNVDGDVAADIVGVAVDALGAVADGAAAIASGAVEVIGGVFGALGDL